MTRQVISLAMWGLYPAAVEVLDTRYYLYVREVEREQGTWQEVEIQWLLAWWDRYMVAIERGETFELTHLGRSLSYRLRTIDKDLDQVLKDLKWFEHRLAKGLRIPSQYLRLATQP